MKKLLTLQMVVFFTLGFLTVSNAETKKAVKKPVKKSNTSTKAVLESEGQLVAYYFHGNFRCATCHKLEEYAKEALEKQFKKEIDSGKLVFKTVNVEEKGSGHFVKDYKLYTKAIIVSTVKNGKETKWKNLEKIWDYVGSKEKYFNYVKEEVSQLLKEI